jgi:hypothetical protein
VTKYQQMREKSDSSPKDQNPKTKTKTDEQL